MIIKNCIYCNEYIIMCIYIYTYGYYTRLFELNFLQPMNCRGLYDINRRVYRYLMRSPYTLHQSFHKIPQTVQKIVLALNTIYRILFLITKMFWLHFIRFYPQFDICFLFHDIVFYREQIDNVP